jgi:hypothetical protein
MRSLLKGLISKCYFPAALWRPVTQEMLTQTSYSSLNDLLRCAHETEVLGRRARRVALSRSVARPFVRFQMRALGQRIPGDNENQPPVRIRVSAGWN